MIGHGIVFLIVLKVLPLALELFPSRDATNTFSSENPLDHTQAVKLAKEIP